MTTLQEIFVDINGANRYVTVSAKAEDDASWTTAHCTHSRQAQKPGRS